jgi:hypothetical protein
MKLDRGIWKYFEVGLRVYMWGVVIALILALTLGVATAFASDIIWVYMPIG